MKRPWKTIISINISSGTPIYLQIANSISKEIFKGRFPVGMTLPGTRSLAEELGVNRKTVVIAYEELVGQGWVRTEKGSGTFVAEKIPVNTPVAAAPDINSEATSASFKFNTFDFFQLKEDFLPGSIIFNDGTPDVRLTPFKSLGKIYKSVLEGKGRRNMLGYSDAKGSVALRKALAEMLVNERGLTTSYPNIFVTRGSQMALYLVAQVLISPGDLFVVESPGYKPAWEAFRTAGANIISVSVDEYGANINELQEICKNKRIKGFYCTPHHQFPTTATLSAERRKHLLALSQSFNFCIVEDDYDHEFHYSFKPVLPLASSDLNANVVYIGSLTKLLAPGLRIGYISGNSSFIEELSKFRNILDRQGDNILEESIAQLIIDGEIRRHTRKAHKEYLKRRDIFCDLLVKRLGKYLSFKIPEGGLSVWVEFIEDINVNVLSKKAISHFVGITPGTLFALSSKDKVNGVRMGFASLNPAELAEGILRLEKSIINLK